MRFLLPMQYQELTDERSLLEGTGESFTVVGKVVRIFGPGPNSERRSSYTDSATQEVWRQPLEQAPASLVQRASVGCQQKTVEGKRGCLTKKLRQQTTLKASRPGAVIIPIAIYK